MLKLQGIIIMECL